MEPTKDHSNKPDDSPELARMLHSIKRALLPDMFLKDQEVTRSNLPQLLKERVDSLATQATLLEVQRDKYYAEDLHTREGSRESDLFFEADDLLVPVTAFRTIYGRLLEILNVTSGSVEIRDKIVEQATYIFRAVRVLDENIFPPKP